ncbi:MAG: phosphatase PAP2 family protein [Firmicutes bacterium]|nr:phosphatase PAP2 family protein [Bacillota bacterium]MCM1401686.1 phosphatase PAP2 family protein [Bacteroides sp.]MCM1477537.1 phosphatase PAP2 family protein [Bacteroides sp.]
MTKFFRIVSAIFSPLVVPCYGIALALNVTALRVIPFQAKIGVVTICAIIIFIVPALAVMALHRAGIITDVGLNSRKERTIPYCISIACYGVAAYYLYRLSGPGWLVGIMVGGMATILINMVVNFKWKISGHMAAMGGLMSIAIFLTVNHLAVVNMLWIVIVTILLSGLVGTARLALNRHTPLQVLAGTTNGFICVYLACALL